ETYGERLMRSFINCCGGRIRNQQRSFDRKCEADGSAETVRLVTAVSRGRVVRQLRFGGNTIAGHSRNEIVRVMKLSRRLPRITGVSAPLSFVEGSSGFVTSRIG